MYAGEKSKFVDHLIQRGHEIRNTEEIMTIYTHESNHEKIKNPEEFHIMKTAISNILNDDINSKNDPLFRLLPPVEMYMLNSE